MLAANAQSGIAKSIALTAPAAISAPITSRREKLRSVIVLAPGSLASIEKTPQVLAREVPVEAVLEADVLAGVAVVVRALAPEQFAAREDPAGGMPKQIYRGVLAFMKGGSGLEIRIFDAVEAVADRGGPLLRPVEVDVRSPAEQLHRLRARHQDEARRFRDDGDVWTKVHPAIVHVARNAAAINGAEPERC